MNITFQVQAIECSKMTNTYVSNAYSDIVFAQVKGDALAIAGTKREVGGSVRLGYVGVGGKTNEYTKYDNSTILKGYTRIPPGRSIPFHPHTAKNRVYVTLTTADHLIICENHALRLGQNVIVDTEATLRVAKKKSFIGKLYEKWIDEDGNDFKASDSDSDSSSSDSSDSDDSDESDDSDDDDDDNDDKEDKENKADEEKNAADIDDKAVEPIR